MNQEIYRSAVGQIPFSEDLSGCIMNRLAAHAAKGNDETGPDRQTKRKRAIGGLAAVATMVGIVVLCLAHQNSGSGFTLPNAVGNVAVRYVGKAPSQGVSTDQIVFLSEEELLHGLGQGLDTAIFKGTVETIRNVEIDIGGAVSYRAIATIRVETVYRGA